MTIVQKFITTLTKIWNLKWKITFPVDTGRFAGNTKDDMTHMTIYNISSVTQYSFRGGWAAGISNIFLCLATELIYFK